MGKLLDDIQETANVRRSVIAKILAGLDASDRKDLQNALDNHNIPAVAIRAALVKRDIKISISAIHRYRNGEIDFEPKR